MPKVRGLLEAALFVEDPARASAFYEQLLGLRKIRSDERGSVFRLAARQYLLLVTYEAARTPSKPPGGIVPPCAMPGCEGPGPGHVALTVSTDALDSWRQRLENHGIEILGDVAWGQGERSLYFRDPDGNLVELATPRIWELA